jgi:hypothetical protein
VESLCVYVCVCKEGSGLASHRIIAKTPHMDGWIMGDSFSIFQGNLNAVMMAAPIGPIGRKKTGLEKKSGVWHMAMAYGTFDGRAVALDDFLLQYCMRRVNERCALKSSLVVIFFFDKLYSLS